LSAKQREGKKLGPKRQMYAVKSSNGYECGVHFKGLAVPLSPDQLQTYQRPAFGPFRKKCQQCDKERKRPVFDLDFAPGRQD